MRLSSPHALLLALPLILLAACSSHEHEGTEAAAPREVPASLYTVEPVEMPTFTPTPGTLVAVEAVQLASRIMGYIRALNVVEGQAVSRGELLFEIDPIDVQSAVHQAEQGLRQAEAAYADAKADYQRFDQLYKDEAVNRQQYEKMRLNYEVAQSRVAQARAALEQARGQLAYTRVGSPIDGVVIAKFAHEGDLAAPGQPVLALEDGSRLQVQTSVPEGIFRTLKVGDTVEVEVEGLSEPLPARVARLSPAADPIARTYSVKLDIAGEGLRSGSFARVLFHSGSRQVLAVPASALVQRAGIRGVFVVDGEGLARFRMLRTGRREEGMVEVLSGLSAGERVVSEGAAKMENGDRPISGQDQG